MKWTVTYRPSAEKDLANVWMNAVDRDAVAHAADEIDRILGSTPLEVGEARAGSARIIIEWPLTVLYKVFPDDFQVSVHAISYWRRLKK